MSTIDVATNRREFVRAAALARHLTPDGFPGGVAQLNRGGDSLQRGGYRVLGQFALGLYGQLLVALRSSPSPE